MKRIEIIFYLDDEEIEGLDNDEIGDLVIEKITQNGEHFECRVL